MALTPVPPDHVAAVVTTLELRTPPQLRPLTPSPLRLVRWAHPDPDKYRTLFRRVGAPWLWFSRLVLDDHTLLAAIRRPETQVHAVVDRAGVEVGILELSHPAPGWCSLDYFGLVPELVGQRHGAWLMALAMQLAWRPGVSFVRVHTCTLDHPRALGFYQAHGFMPVRRELETFVDPRTTGVLPPDAAPHIPLLSAL